MDKAKLLAKRTNGTRKVTIPGVGAVTVRGLTRAQVKAARDDNDDIVENRLIAAALVDPVLTPDEVAEWLDHAAAGEAVAVMQAISDLSALGEGAQKSGVSGVRG